MKPTLLPLILLVLAASCTNKVLNAPLTSSLTSESFWKTPQDADLALNAIFSTFRDHTENYLYFDALSDNVYNNFPWEGFKTISEGIHNASTPRAIVSVWKTNFQGIGRANDLLAHIDALGLSKESYEDIKGQALFFRAFFYFNLSDLYGGVPVIIEAPSLKQGKLSRNTKEEVIAQIVKDLDASYSLMSVDKKNDGRASRDAAMALKARVLLYNEKWTAASEAAKTVMDNGKYSLYTKGKTPYRDLFLEENEGNTEVLLDAQYQFPQQSTYDGLLLGAASKDMGWSSIVPLQSFVDAYEMLNGLPITDPASGYDANKPFDKRDPRLKQTIFVPGSTYNGIANFTDAMTGYAFKKYTYYDEDKVQLPYAYGGQMSGINTIAIRYAEVLLTYAEAKNEASGPDATVYDAVNKVRARVGMPALPAGLDQSKMREAIRGERRVEFPLEGMRYSDLRRWKIAKDVLNGFQELGATVGQIEVPDPNDPNKTVKVQGFDPNAIPIKKGIRKYLDYFGLWPIPQEEFNIEGTNLNQNNGF